VTGSRKGLGRQLRQGDALHALLQKADGVEGDIDAVGFFHHRLHVPLHRLLVHLGRLGHASGILDCLGHRAHAGEAATCQKDPRPFAGEGLCRGSADRASDAVDDGGLVR
jgi:hypothetical protein